MRTYESSTALITPEELGVVDKLKIASKKTLAGITLLALASCGVGNRANEADNQSTNESQPSVTEVMPTTSQAIDNTTDQSTTTSETGIETTPSSQDTLRQTMTVEQMDQLSIADFAKLSIADRMAYGLDKIGADAFHTGDLPVEAIPALVWQSIYNTAFNDADPNVRAKIMGSYIYYSTDKNTGEIDDSYKSNTESAMQIGGAGIGGSETMQYLSSGQLQQGKDRDGNPIEFINITYNQSDGSSAPVEWTSQAIKCNITLIDGQKTVFYAEGYSIEGHASPVDNYPY